VGVALGWRLTAWVAATGSVGCVLAVDETVTIREQVDLIVIDVAAGDVSVRGNAGDVKLTGNFGGAGQDPPRHTLSGGVLTVLSDCGLCGGELSIDAPPETELSITVGAGDLVVDGMVARLDAAVAGGSARVRGHGAGPVILDAEIGDVNLAFRDPPDRVDVNVATGFVEIDVPPGGYALELRAPAGSVSIQGIEDDPSSEHQIVARTGAGSISVRGR
jgi:hypothetical protein